MYMCMTLTWNLCTIKRMSSFCYDMSKTDVTCGQRMDQWSMWRLIRQSVYNDGIGYVITGQWESLSVCLRGMCIYNNIIWFKVMYWMKLCSHKHKHTYIHTHNIYIHGYIYTCTHRPSHVGEGLRWKSCIQLGIA